MSTVSLLVTCINIDAATARGATVTDVRRIMALKDFVSRRPLATSSAELRLLRRGMRITSDKTHKIATGLRALQIETDKWRSNEK